MDDKTFIDGCKLIAEGLEQVAEALGGVELAVAKLPDQLDTSEQHVHVYDVDEIAAESARQKKVLRERVEVQE